MRTGYGVFGGCEAPQAPTLPATEASGRFFEGLETARLRRSQPAGRAIRAELDLLAVAVVNAEVRGLRRDQERVRSALAARRRGVGR